MGNPPGSINQVASNVSGTLKKKDPWPNWRLKYCSSIHIASLATFWSQMIVFFDALHTCCFCCIWLSNESLTYFANVWDDWTLNTRWVSLNTHDTLRVHNLQDTEHNPSWTFQQTRHAVASLVVAVGQCSTIHKENQGLPVLADQISDLFIVAYWISSSSSSSY